MGPVHAQNLINRGFTVMAVEMPKNFHPTLPNFNCKEDLSKLVEDGYDSCVISIPEPVTAREAIRAMEAGFKKILLDKPGATSSSELFKVLKASQKHKTEVFMNY